MLRAYLTHAWKPDKPVTIVRNSNSGWILIDDNGKQYLVPADQIEYKEIDLDDLL